LLINRQEFGGLFGGIFAENIIKNANQTLDDLYISYQFTEIQKESISNMVFNYNRNKEIIKAYYYFDTKLKKQKKRALNYVFNQEFKALMESYNIPYKKRKAIRQKYTWE